MINDTRLIKLIQKILSIDAQNPPGNEWDCAKFIESDMRSLGLDVKLYTYADRRPNIVATLKGSLPRAQAKREAILITPHFDTVPIGTGWKYDPYGSDIVKGRLYGRGASDDKGNCASAMEVMRSLVEDKVVLQKDVIMAATVDEETGSKFGIIPLLENKVFKPKFALVLDSDEYDAIIVQKGLLHLNIEIYGTKAHGAYNWLGENAIEVAARVIGKLKKLTYPHKKHALLKGPTMNVGVIRGGDKVNMVSDFCAFALDVRYMPGTDPKVLKALIRDTIKTETNRFKISVYDLQYPYEIKADHPCVLAYLKTAAAQKVPVELRGSEGATVMTFFKKHGIAAFATGFGASGTAHANDEYLKVNTLIKGTKFLEQFIKDYDRL